LMYAKSPASIKMRGLFVSAVCAMVAVRCTLVNHRAGRHRAEPAVGLDYDI